MRECSVYLSAIELIVSVPQCVKTHLVRSPCRGIVNVGRSALIVPVFLLFAPLVTAEVDLAKLDAYSSEAIAGLLVEAEPDDAARL